MDGHAAIGSQTGTIIGIFQASGNADAKAETEEGSPLRGSSSATVTSRRRARAIARALFPGVLVLRRSIIHATHAATGHGRHGCLLLRSLGDHRFSSDEQASNRGRIL